MVTDVFIEFIGGHYHRNKVIKYKTVYTDSFDVIDHFKIKLLYGRNNKIHTIMLIYYV